MPRLKLTKSAIDALPEPPKDIVYWDTSSPGFGVKVTPKGRKVFIVLYRTAGAGSRVRKYTIGPYGRVTLHQARVAAQKVHTARLEGRDPAAEKSEAKRRIVVDRVEDVLEAFIAQHVSRNRSAREVSRMPRREIGSAWGGRSIHEISKRDIIDVIFAIDQAGRPGLELPACVPRLRRQEPGQAGISSGRTPHPTDRRVRLRVPSDLAARPE